MTKLNRDINNRFYTLLMMWFYGTDEETEQLERTLNFLAKNYGNDWDKAERVELLMWRYDSAPSVNQKPRKHSLLISGCFPFENMRPEKGHNRDLRRAVPCRSLFHSLC